MRLIPSNPPNVSARAVRLAWTAVGIVALLIVIGGVVWLVRLSSENDAQERSIAESDAERAELSKRLDDEHAAAQTLAEQVKRLGGKPVVEPGEAPAGPPGPGPTSAQVRAAVADYCTADRCKPAVSRAQVAAAVADYCAAGACRGKDGVGTDGADGQDGTDGANGAPGPGPTPEQIADAVEAYCAGGKCRGEPGRDGTDGTDGKDATITPSGMDCPDRERVKGVHIAADGTLTVTCAPFIGRE